MELQVLGIGDAFTARHYNTSFLIRSSRPFLVDAPPALFRLLRERNLDPGLINDVIVTHVHGDHTAGLEALMLWKKYVQRQPLALYTSQTVYRELEERFFPGFAETFSPDLQKIVSSRFSDYARFVRLRDEAPTRLDRGLEIEIRENWHPTPTLGLKLRSRRGCVAISGDTCYRPSLLKQLRKNAALDPARYEKLAGSWLWEADVIYHEVARGESTLHTLEEDLLALPEKIRRKIRLVHVADDFVEGRLKVATEGEIVAF